jgi:hypothetical protein
MFSPEILPASVHDLPLPSTGHPGVPSVPLIEATAPFALMTRWQMLTYIGVQIIVKMVEQWWKVAPKLSESPSLVVVVARARAAEGTAWLH